MKKKFGLLIILATCIFMFSGCATSTYMIEYNVDGSIVQSFDVNLDIEELNNAGYNTSECINNINTYYLNYWNNKYADMQYNLNSNSVLTELERTQILDGVTKEIVNTNNSVELKITYANSYVASLVNTDSTNVETENKTETEVKDYFFVKKITSKQNSAFFGVNELGLTQELKEFYSTYNMDEDMTFYEVYAYSKRRIHSSADKIIYNNGLYYHYFKIDNDYYENMSSTQSPKTQIEFYRFQANPIGWYLISILVSCIFIIVSLKINIRKQQKIINEKQKLDIATK